MAATSTSHSEGVQPSETKAPERIFVSAPAEFKIMGPPTTILAQKQGTPPQSKAQVKSLAPTSSKRSVISRTMATQCSHGEEVQSIVPEGLESVTCRVFLGLLGSHSSVHGKVVMCRAITPPLLPDASLLSSPAPMGDWLAVFKLMHAETALYYDLVLRAMADGAAGVIFVT